MAEFMRNRMETKLYPRPTFEYDEVLVEEYELDDETGDPKLHPRTKAKVVKLYGHLAFCKNCFRWRTYGSVCQACQWISDIDWPLTNELARDFARLLLATQHLFDPSVPDGGNPTVKAAMRPGFFMNNPLSATREMMERLKGVAASVGRVPEELMPAGAVEIVVDIGGVPTRALKRGNSVTLIGPVDAQPVPVASAAPRQEAGLPTTRRREVVPAAPEPEPVAS